MGKANRCRKIRPANKRLKKQTPAPFATGGIITANDLKETVLSKEDLLKDREIEPNVFHFKGETLVKDRHYNLIVSKIKEINEQEET